MIPYLPTWEAHNTSGHNLVGKFTMKYCNVPRGKVQSQKYAYQFSHSLRWLNKY